MDQDSFNLNLSPAFSGNLLKYCQNLDDSFEIIEKEDLGLNEPQDSKDKFFESYQKVFPSFALDNKKVSITEIKEIKEIKNIDDFIVNFQEELDEDYYNKNFDIIIEKIEKRFPFFFNEKTNGLLYIIQKLKFYELLRQDRLKEAKQFFKEKLLFLVKEIKKENWEKKSKFFIKLIKRPKIIFKQGELQKKYYDKYTYELEKAIRNFLHDDNDLYNNDISNSKNDISLIHSQSNQSNINFNHLFSSSSIDLNSFNKKNSNISDNLFTDKIQEKSEITKDTIQPNQEEKDDLDLENCSTKEEFSDFEDEIQQKCVDNQEQKEQNEENSINIYGNNILEPEYKLDPVHNNMPNLSSYPFSEKSSNSLFHLEENDDIFSNQNKNEFIIDTSSKNLQNICDEDKFNNDFKNNNNKNIIHFEEINTNINIPNTQNKKEKEKEKEPKKYKKKKKNKEEETIFNQLPYLNSFKPKYIKRETIDKKIIRSFKNYVVKEYKSNHLIINDKTMDQNFFINFVNGNLLPPLDFHDINTGEYIKFNSFNCSFLLWFFSKKGVKEIYNQFINEKGKEFTENLSQYYEISTEEKNQLNSYIMNFPNIFDISIVNSITNGATVKHLYRTVDKNQKINERGKRTKPDLDLKRIKSNESECERFRSREFDNNDEL